MTPHFARFDGSGKLRHALSLATFIITMFSFRLSFNTAAQWFGGLVALAQRGALVAIIFVTAERSRCGANISMKAYAKPGR